jgi:hypothetical protein
MNSSMIRPSIRRASTWLAASRTGAATCCPMNATAAKTNAMSNALQVIERRPPRTAAGTRPTTTAAAIVNITCNAPAIRFTTRSAVTSKGPAGSPRQPHDVKPGHGQPDRFTAQEHVLAAHHPPPLDG